LNNVTNTLTFLKCEPKNKYTMNGKHYKSLTRPVQSSNSHLAKTVLAFIMRLIIMTGERKGDGEREDREERERDRRERERGRGRGLIQKNFQ
jgi:hypothetical protein